jgi:hypothetical protein
MIRLRSAMPNSGLLTLRHPLPPLNPVDIPELPVVSLAETELTEADLVEADLTENEAEKGGDAR